MEINFFFVFKNNDMFIDYFVLKSNFGYKNKIIFFAFPITFFDNFLIFKYSVYTRYSEEKF